MEPTQAPVQAGWLTESRKDFIAGGLFLALGVGALLFFRLHRIPLNLPMPTILKDFSHDLFIFQPR